MIKHVSKTALILATITCILTFVVCLFYILLTPIIEKNNEKMELETVEKLYPDSTIQKLTVEDSEVIKKLYLIDEVNYLYIVSGKNSYGEISLIVVINQSNEVILVETLKNTQSYKSLANNFINSFYKNFKINSSNISDVDVFCGATSSAKLVVSLVEKVLEYQESVIS